MSESVVLTANSTIAQWLEHPVGGDLIRGLLAASGTTEDALGPVRSQPLQQLVALSQGQLPQSVVDDLVRQANGGTMPEQTGPAPWVERVVAGRFAGRTVIVTGAASGIGRAVASRVLREDGRVIAVDVSADRLDELVAAHDGEKLVAVARDIAHQGGGGPSGAGLG